MQFIFMKEDFFLSFFIKNLKEEKKVFSFQWCFKKMNDSINDKMLLFQFSFFVEKKNILKNKAKSIVTVKFSSRFKFYVRAN
jgi:hypothetical protein